MRDSGVTHALLGITTVTDLLGHPVAGGSWEGCVIENLTGALPKFALEDLNPTPGLLCTAAVKVSRLAKGSRRSACRT